MLLKESIVKFISYRETKTHSEQTLKSYRNDLSHFNSYLERQLNCMVYIDEITTEDVEGYQNSLCEKGLKPASVNRYLASVRSMFNYGIKKQWVGLNVAKAVENVHNPKRERQYLTKEEIFQLVEAIEKPLLKTAVLFLAMSGLRISELISLTMDSVDLDRHVITCIGKGNKERSIPISETLYPIIDDYLKNHRQSKSDFFFATKKTGSLSDGYMNVSLRTAANKLGWKKEVSCHILRHSFATHLVHNGIGIVDLQRLLGHELLSTTSIYVHTNPERLRTAVNVW